MLSLRLHWTDIEGRPQKYEGTLPVTLGRHQDNTIQFEAQKVSRWHARLEMQGDEVVLIDNSANGTFVNGQPVGRTALENGDEIEIGPFLLTVILHDKATDSESTLSDTDSIDATLVSEEDFLTIPPVLAAAHKTTFPPDAFDQQLVPVQLLQDNDLPLEETDYLTIGGGLGSFIWVDYLRAGGVPTGNIVSIGVNEKPYDNFQKLGLNSQITATDRLRSGSAACPDNLWGWPGYGIREVGQAMAEGHLRQASQLTWQLVTEPILNDTYTPRSGMMFAAIDREANRIDWASMHRFGRVRSIRKTADGRYVVAYSQTKESSTTIHKLIICRFLHIAIGYPAIRLLPDLQAYRQQTDDFTQVVHAYEAHESIYEQLQEQGGTLLLRGRGIVASHILQRLYEVRLTNPNLVVIHLVRAPKSLGAHFGRAQRVLENQWEFQQFNWPQGTWSGPARAKLAKATPDQRDKLLRAWGGTTTAQRSYWRHIVQTGLTEGWYQQHFGTVQQVERNEAGNLVTVIQSYDLPQEVHLAADFIIDATGLISDVSHHPLLDDLMTHYNLTENMLHHLDVSLDFEVIGLRNGAGSVFTSGISAQFGYAPADSFLGLNYAAQRSITQLCKANAPYLQPLRPLRSVAQWLRWVRGVAPT